MQLDINILMLSTALSFMVVLTLYMFFKDKSTNKKLKDFEYVIEEMNKQLFAYEKKLKKSNNEDDQDRLKNNIKEEILSEFDNEIKKVLVNELKELIDKLVHTINTLKQEFDTNKEEINIRLERLEEKTKEYMSVPTSAAIDENRVKALFKAGYNKEEIARELHVSVSEISFILNILNLQKGE